MPLHCLVNFNFDYVLKKIDFLVVQKQKSLLYLFPSSGDRLLPFLFVYDVSKKNAPKSSCNMSKTKKHYKTLRLQLLFDLSCHWHPFSFIGNTATGPTYLKMLQNWLFTFQQADLIHFIFQKDGAPPHWHFVV